MRKQAGLKMAGTVLGALSLLGISACMSNRLTIPDDFEFEPIGAFRQAAAADQGPYRLRFGDEIEIKFFYNSDLNDTVKIRPDGNISLMLVDDVVAAGLTTSELDRELTRLYSEKLSRVDLTVIVREFARQYVYVDGEVRNPSAMLRDQPIRVRQAIASAGGVTEAADLQKVLLMRTVDGKTVMVTKLDLSDLRQLDNVDVYLQAYDIVYVPTSGIGEANQFVQQYLSNMVPDWIRVSFPFTYSLNRGNSATPAVILGGP